MYNFKLLFGNKLTDSLQQQKKLNYSENFTALTDWTYKLFKKLILT